MTVANRERLLSVACRQAGLFTGRQAVAAGIQQSNHSHMTETGSWERVASGVYRLPGVEAEAGERRVWEALLILTKGEGLEGWRAELGDEGKVVVHAPASVPRWRKVPGWIEVVSPDAGRGASTLKVNKSAEMNKKA